MGTAYAGSVSCNDCHPATYSTWSNSGHAHALNISSGSTAPTYPYSSVPNPPSGSMWSDVTYVQGGYAWKANFLDSTGYIMTGPGKQYNLIPSGFVQFTDVAYPPGMAYDDSCAKCHATNWQYSATNHQDGLAGIMGTWFEPGVGCEACHRDAAGLIHLDNSAFACGTCHSRSDAGQIEVIAGLIADREQYDELMNSPMASLTCMDCHNPHKNTVYGGGGIRIDQACTSCHPGPKNIAPLAHAGFACVDCHMPPVAMCATSSGSGNYLNGDMRSHIFKIDRTKNPADMLYTSGPGTYAYGYITVNYACLYCHNGTDAILLNVDQAKASPVLIHAP
ncbi:MAG: cytochrome c3 family protein [Planctomycetota bacterium]|jgi:hypothetical protein